MKKELFRQYFYDVKNDFLRKENSKLIKALLQEIRVGKSNAGVRAIKLTMGTKKNNIMENVMNLKQAPDHFRKVKKKLEKANMYYI